MVCHGREDAVDATAWVEEWTSSQPLGAIGKHRAGVVTTTFMRIEAQAAAVMCLMTQLVGHHRCWSWIRRVGSRRTQAFVDTRKKTTVIAGAGHDKGPR
jgi:hypothetical protein